MTEQKPPELERVEPRPCGCKLIHFKQQEGQEPILPQMQLCLSDALVGAGDMLMQAGMRIREVQDMQRKAMEAQINAQIRKQAGL
jgi:hypothetical protein